jgi:hypothetical protein
LAVARSSSLEEARRALLQSRDLQRAIWSESVMGCRETPTPAVIGLILPTLNAMFEISNSRIAAAETHLPALVSAQLIILPLLCSLLAGLNSASRPRRSWIHMLAFPAILSLTVFVILDLEYPRSGLIRLDTFDRTLLELRNTMRGVL